MHVTKGDFDEDGNYPEHKVASMHWVYSVQGRIAVCVHTAHA